jgi:hypothetical protein
MGGDTNVVHDTTIVAWDVPSAIIVGDRFRMKVGIKCRSECGLSMARLEVYDHTGVRVASAALPDEVWPGTTGLYVTEVELAAPAEEGLHEWSVRTAEGHLETPHPVAATSVRVRTVARPEHDVAIQVIDRAAGRPLAGARIVMHPYRAETNEQGVAVVRVGKGTYRMFVSQTGYVTSGQDVDVASDLATRVELEREPPIERN